MATLSDIRTTVARALRDTSNVTWSADTLDDLINQGLDALADFYPREIVSDIGTVSASVSSYAATGFTSIYRLDVYTSAGSYRQTLPHGIGEGPGSGWELHGGVVYLPPRNVWPLDAGDVLRAFGYGRYTVLTADLDTTDADAAGVQAVAVFCQAEAFQQLLANRAAFQQWQASPGNTDVSLLALNQVAMAATRRWDRERARLRRMRKVA